MPAFPFHYAKRDLPPGDMPRERPHLGQRELRAGEDNQPAIAVGEVIAAIDRRDIRVCDGEALDPGRYRATEGRLRRHTRLVEYAYGAVGGEVSCRKARPASPSTSILFLMCAFVGDGTPHSLALRAIQHALFRCR
jgi:hypothetical protein